MRKGRECYWDSAKKTGGSWKSSKVRERWVIVCCAKVGSAVLKNPGKALKHGVVLLNVIKNPIKTIKHGVGALVHGGKALLTNRVKCNGHVWGHLDGTDIQTDVYFTRSKLAMRDSKFPFKICMLTGNLISVWTSAGLGSILVGGKKKVVGMLKNVIQKLVDSKIRQVENMLVEKINASNRKWHFGYVTPKTEYAAYRSL